jgi:hypothetical protein
MQYFVVKLKLMKLKMLLDSVIIINVKSSRTISMLDKLEIFTKIGDLIKLPIDKLWKKSNIKVNVKCDICEFEKVINFSMYNKNISKYGVYCCSNKCSSFKNKKTSLERYGDENYNNREKSKETSLERYGDENYNNREKNKETCLIKYGVINPLLNDDVKVKARKTNLERYGVEDSRSSDYVKDKRKNTNLERYGVESYVNTYEYKEKVKRNSLERYGVDSPNKVQFIKDKKVKSMLKKYGYISNSMTKDSKDRLKKTNLERYGVEYPMQVLEFCEKQQKNSKKIRYYNDDIYYQSSYEKDFLDYLKNIDMLSKVTRGPIIKYNNGISDKIHYPDFYIEDYNLIIEIKSDYYYYKYLDINNLKFNKAIEIGYNYMFIINKNYKYFNEYMSIIKKENQS